MQQSQRTEPRSPTVCVEPVKDVQASFLVKWRGRPVGVRVGEFWPHSGEVRALEQIAPPALVKPDHRSHPSPRLYGGNIPLGGDMGTGMQGALGNVAAAAVGTVSTQ